MTDLWDWYIYPHEKLILMVNARQIYQPHGSYDFWGVAFFAPCNGGLKKFFFRIGIPSTFFFGIGIPSSPNIWYSWWSQGPHLRYSITRFNWRFFLQDEIRSIGGPEMFFRERIGFWSFCGYKHPNSKCLESPKSDGLGKGVFPNFLLNGHFQVL